MGIFVRVYCLDIGESGCDLGMYVARYITLYGFYIICSVCELFM